MKRILTLLLIFVLALSVSGCKGKTEEEKKVEDLSLADPVVTTEKEKEFDASNLDFELVVSSEKEPASIGEWVLTKVSDSFVCFRITEVDTDSKAVASALETLGEGRSKIYNLSEYDLGDDLEFAIVTYEIYVPDDYLGESVSSPKLKLLPPDGGMVMKYDNRETVLYGDMTFPIEKTVPCKPGDTVTMHSLFIRQKSSVNYVISNYTARNAQDVGEEYMFWYTEG